MTVEYHRAFQKDVHRLEKSGWDMKPLSEFIETLFGDQWPPDEKYEMHRLKGDLKGILDIHLRQNWIVFLQKKNDRITLLRTGTHAMLGLG